jgi:ribosome-associated protein
MNNNEPTGDEDDFSSDVTSSNPESLNRFMRVGAAAKTESAPEAEIDTGIPRTTDVKEYSLQLATAAARVALDNNGTDVLILDVCNQTALFDYFVLATGTSRRQLHAISEEIDDVLEKQMGDKRIGIEGYEDSRWIVLDYGSVVIHLFDEETRSYYDLESLWADATVVPLTGLGLRDSGASSHSDN